MIAFIVYAVVFLLTFFAASFAVARYCRVDDPTDPETLFVLAGYALAWPIMIPLTVVIFFLFGIARLAEKVTGGAK